MIEDIPTAQQLNASALKLFFSGWHEVVEILNDFERARGADFEEERQDYYNSCSSELQSTLTLTAQACEIALKARICAVSPFLLLVGVDNKLSGNAEAIKFSDLRTLDAVDLVRTVNAVTVSPVSPALSEQFKELRELRNRSMHLGFGNPSQDPERVFELLQDIFQELWPERSFLCDWREYLEGTRHSYFHDYKWSSPQMEISELLEEFFHRTTNSRFQKLFGFQRTKRRYTCLECYFGCGVENIGYCADDFQTAHLLDAKTLKCLLCGDETEVTRTSCTEPNCPGNVISNDDSGYPITCHTCTREQASE